MTVRRRIDELLRAGPTTSFEFFPPRDDAGRRRLSQTIDELAEFDPSFVSVTYGAGGSTRDRTAQVVDMLLAETDLVPMAHVTSVCHRHEELVAILRGHLDRGVRNLMLLRGDPPRGVDDAFWELAHAVDFVALARQVGGDAFCIGVAAHPEGHPLSETLVEDRNHLAAKLEAADFGVTQFFFDVTLWTSLVNDLADRGCHRPVIPGVIPITDTAQIERFAALSGTRLPGWLTDRLDRAADDPAEVARIGVDVATELSQQLLDAGAPGLHFYTLNRSGPTRAILENLRGR